ncbi:translational activator for mitochondrial COX1 [Tilletia horrida]|uniref:Translational activator for mitochondrial COX1 n=1 Tax=Tilletia horrida TaxID=155126 RepID=A0AAN6GT34_9BASI|nr:translational activator for mitochondrial COX1 [Tilletia horrida]KAK0568671.1 translational activator for mitochondrial COX1 [Tilletia horrida]
MRSTVTASAAAAAVRRTLPPCSPWKAASSSSLAVGANSRRPQPQALSAQHPQQQQRSIFGGLFGSKKKQDPFEVASRGGASGGKGKKQPILSQDNLFHPLSKSPIPAIRQRGERVRALAACPVSMNKHGVRRPVQFECPDCGWPTHYSEAEWREDPDHAQYVPRLREANEDEHDLRSGRDMTEFKFPGQQGFEEVINMSNWDIYFYTRNHESLESERSVRHVTKVLTFPCTLAGVLHENSPYTRRNQRLTHEGLRSLIALRQTLHPTLGDKPSLDVVRIFLVGARAESTLPPHVWDQLTYMFPGVALHIFMVGPEAVVPEGAAAGTVETYTGHPSIYKSNTSSGEAGASGSASAASTGVGSSVSMHRSKLRKSNYGFPSRTLVVSPGLTITTIRATYEDVHAQFEPFDPYTDVFFAFSPGFGFPSQVAVRELEESRRRDRQDEVDRKEARRVYFAGAESGAELGDKSGSAATAAASGISQRPFVAADPSVQPEGGDIPSAEPPEAFPESENELGSPTPFTALTTAPIVQAQREWARALGHILSTKCALISTGFSPADVERDVLAFENVEGVRGEFEWLITPGENVFASRQWVIADFDPRVAVKANWGLWAVRGKRYDIEGPKSARYADAV